MCVHVYAPCNPVCACSVVCISTCCSVCMPGCMCVCVSACSVAMMALLWMIDVVEGAARSSGWARASVWHTVSSLLLYICRRSKTPSPLPSECASRTNTADTHRFSFFGLNFEASFSCLKVNWVFCVFLATPCFLFYSWQSQPFF